MRRLDTPCVFLQYRKEPHHPASHADQQDDSIRFKVSVDHDRRGTEVPTWLRRGETYDGR